MKNTTVKLVYNRKNILNKNGEALIQIEIYHNKKRKYFSTNIYLKPEEWDNKKSTVNKKNPKFTTLNLILNKQVEKIQQSIYDKQTKGIDIDFEDFIQKDESKENFYPAFEKYLFATPKSCIYYLNIGL